jgi:methyl-accepting chemotaxis protein
VNSDITAGKREERFMNNVKVQTKLSIVMLATIVALVLCAVISSESMKQLQSKALETMEADERESYDEQIKQQVDNVVSLC